MSGLSTTIRIGDGDRIAVRERTNEPGCAITAFCGDVLIFLSAEKEAELLAALLERAPKLPLRAVPAVEEGLRRLTAADFPLNVDIGLGSPHGDPAGSGDLAIPPEPTGLTVAAGAGRVIELQHNGLVR